MPLLRVDDATAPSASRKTPVKTAPRLFQTSSKSPTSPVSTCSRRPRHPDPEDSLAAPGGGFAPLLAAHLRCVEYLVTEVVFLSLPDKEKPLLRHSHEVEVRGGVLDLHAGRGGAYCVGS
ncbi:hypothetical protein EJB05_07608, partial [Eragrostis curvula]